tara:strand:+ start:99 stop:527 length:429 start_codon:yes stop_codon:yes gene_type:complete
MATVRGTAYWAFVTAPNTTFDPCYTVNLVVDQKTASDFEDRGFNVKQMDEGPAIIIKRKVNGPNGMVRKAPKLYDAKKNEIDVNVGNGSEVVVQYKEWESNWNGRTFKGLDFLKMQVIKLVEFNPEADEFDIEDDEDEEDEL